MKIYIPLDKLKELLEKFARAPVIPTLCISFALGILLARNLHPSIAAAAALSTAALAAALVSHRGRGPLFLLLIATAVVFAGTFLYRVDEAVSPNPHLTRVLRAASAEKRTRFFDTIVESPPRVDDKKARFTVRVLRVGPSPDRMVRVSGLAQASMSTDRPLPHYADRVSFEARAFGTGFLDPPVQEYFKTMGISGFLSIPDMVPVQTTGRARKFFIFKWGKALGVRFRSTITRTIPSPASLVLSQMMFGKIVEIPTEIRDKFRTAGVVHILVVSGLHVWMLLSSFLLLAFLWRRNPFVSFAVLGGVLLLFYSMSGGGPSVTRATIMGLAYLGALLVKRDYDRVSALFLAGLLLLLMSPRSLFHPGLQLSFLACAGIIFIYPLLETVLPHWLRSKPFKPLFLSICATLPIYPVIAYYFNSVSIVSPITNLFVIPLAAILIPFGFTYSIFVTLIPRTALVLAPIITFPVNALLWLVDIFAGLPFSSIAVASPGIAAIAAYFACVFSWAMFLHSMKRGRDETITTWMAAGGGIACALLWLWLFIPPSNMLKVTFIDVGEGDSTLIDAPYDLNGQKRFRLLIDGGSGAPDSSYGSGKERVARTLYQLGISHLDAVLLTHPDLDHLGGLFWVLGNFPVDRFLDPGFLERKARKNTWNIELFKQLQPLPPTPAAVPGSNASESLPEHPHPLNYEISNYKLLLKKVEKLKIERVISRKNLFWKLDSGVSFHILYPGDNDMIVGNLNSNEFSAVLKLSYGETSFLFTGDIEKYGEFVLKKDFGDDLSSTVLKVPHHGSSTSSSVPFLEKVRPLISVFSVGRENLFHHPHEKTLLRYRNIKSSIFRTDKLGNITVATDGKYLFLNTKTLNYASTRNDHLKN